MDLIKEYEMGIIDLTEFSERIHGAVDESLEALVGFQCLQFYVNLANDYHDTPYYVQKYGGDRYEEL